MDDRPSLLQLLIQAADQARGRAEAAFDDAGLSLPRAGVLRALSSGPASMGDLADSLHCGRSNMTSMVDRLERDGWVVREPDPEDRRISLVRITQEGRDVLARAIQVMDEFDARLQDALGQDADAVIVRLRAAVDDDPIQSGPE